MYGSGNYLCGSGSYDPQAKKNKKNLFCDFLFSKTDENVPKVSVKQN